jgi:hypothetical protein
MKRFHQELPRTALSFAPSLPKSKATGSMREEGFMGCDAGMRIGMIPNHSLRLSMIATSRPGIFSLSDQP